MDVAGAAEGRADGRRGISDFSVGHLNSGARKRSYGWVSDMTTVAKQKKPAAYQHHGMMIAAEVKCCAVEASEVGQMSGSAPREIDMKGRRRG